MRYTGIPIKQIYFMEIIRINHGSLRVFSSTNNTGIQTIRRLRGPVVPGFRIQRSDRVVDSEKANPKPIVPKMQVRFFVSFIDNFLRVWELPTFLAGSPHFG